MLLIDTYNFRRRFRILLLAQLSEVAHSCHMSKRGVKRFVLCVSFDVEFQRGPRWTTLRQTLTISEALGPRKSKMRFLCHMSVTRCKRFCLPLYLFLCRASLSSIACLRSANAFWAAITSAGDASCTVEIAVLRVSRPKCPPQDLG